MDLSIITINYNTASLTISCVNSILKHTKKLKYEIIVVDNASKTTSLEQIKNAFISDNRVKIIENKKNMGFSAGNNKGAKRARGKYLLFLNSDTIIHDNVLAEMVKWMVIHAKVGATTCALRNIDGSLQATGGYFPTLFRIFAWMFFVDDLPVIRSIIRPFHPHTPDFLGDNTYTKEIAFDWITGAFIMTTKSIFNKVGGFDEDYFMYTEDTDLCFKIRKLGKNVYYLPKWSITHLGGASGSTENSTINEFKNVLLYHKKHNTKISTSLVKYFLKSGALLRCVVFPSKAEIYKNVYKAI